MTDSTILADAPETTASDSITFADLQLNKPILKALEKSGYTTPTPIQAQSIPHALNGRDLLLSAQTGSGKTAAFVLPVLDKLSRIGKLDKQVYALILTPTRELAQQVHDSVRRYGGNLRGVYSIPLVGGSPYSGQIRALRKGVQIIIATPGRLLDHINEGRVDLSALQMLILDEADRMLDMGFADDINEILQKTPATRQTVMSSATWDGEVGKIAESFTNNPERVSIKIESAHIEESVYFCDDFHHKNKILLQVLANPDIKQAVIFAATKMSTEKLAGELVEAGFKARYLHGDLPQGKRNRIVSDMKSGKCDLLIATDVAARGIDISAISHVINYDLPRQVEDYVHRIGRCGRAGRTGTAINLCSMEDRKQLSNIGRYLKRSMDEAVIEGLEPKRRPKPEKERFGKKDGRKGGRFGKRGEDFAGEREFGKRRGRGERDFRQMTAEFEQNHEHRKQGDFKPDFKQNRKERFGQQDAAKGGRFGKRDEQRGSRYDETRAVYQTDRHEKPRQRYDDAFDFERFGDKPDRKRRDARESGRVFRGKRDFDGKNRTNDKFDKTKADGKGKARQFDKKAKPARQKPIEEVFYAKRQKRKFGADHQAQS